MKKKIGIITFHSAHNYGAVLQVYALKEFLKNRGNEVCVVNYRPKEIDRVYKFVKPTKRTIKGRIKYCIKYGKVMLFNRKVYNKYYKFEKFLKKELEIQNEYKTLKQLQKSNEKFDILIAGSDQIWNNQLTKGFKPAYFLEFGDKNIVRASYAASTGSFEINQYNKELFRRYLKNFDYLSVREESAKNKIRALTANDIEVVLDPTLLVDKEIFDKIKTKRKYRKHYIFVHFIGKNEELIKLAENVSLKLGLPIVHNRSTKIFKNELDHFFGGPNEFISIISNADFVLTNSFHATVFSIMYNKKFFVVPNYGTDRITELLSKLNLNDQIVLDTSEMPDLNFSIDYEQVNSKLETLRKNSVNFLDKVLDGKKNSIVDNYFKTKDKFSCYGCEACKSICPVGAITMKQDNEGFIYPVIDRKKCINCKLCEKTCIYKKNALFQGQLIEKPVYAAINNNETIRENSTSGGVFTELCKYIIKNNGYVIGVKLNKKNEAIYDVATTLEACFEFQGAKYVRADNNNIYIKIKELLVSKKPVLVSGTPCFIAGLKSYLMHEYKNLYLVEIICHSNSSPKIYHKYLRYLEKENNSKIKTIKFRSKENGGWHNSNIKIIFENNHVMEESVYKNIYVNNFLKGKISRPSCYNCEFAYLNRVGDITIGDYWGIDKEMKEMDDNKGTSLVIVNTDKGNQLFDHIKENLKINKSDISKCLKNNHDYPIALSEKRYMIMEKINDDIISALKKN